MNKPILSLATIGLNCLVAIVGSLACRAEGAEPDGNSALEIFKKRITPILAAKNPSSCSECHLSGVDLKDYIRGDQTETFAALRDHGLIDVKNPDGSKLLAFIKRQPTRPSPVTEKVRQQEYESFRAWIHAAVKDPQLAAAKTNDIAIGAKLPDEVIRHARQDRVLQSFLDNVWSEVGRCAACHSPDRNQEQVKKFGEQVSWITLNDPAATLHHLLDADLINIEDPSKSLLLMKPTNQVKHGGGVKLMAGDRTYKQFRGFIEDYAASAKGKYSKREQLPAARSEFSQVSDIWLKFTDIPSQFDKKLLQVSLYRWDEDHKSWSQSVWAFGDRAIAGDRQLWQQHLTLVASKDSKRAKELAKSAVLPPGKYLAKIYVDRTDKLERDYQAELTAEDFVGEVEIQGKWPVGYGAMTTVKFPAGR